MAEELIEQVEEGLDTMVEGAEEVIEATRRMLTGREVGFFVAGAGVGLAWGFALGYRIAERRLKLKYEKLANDDIEAMREHYYQKSMAAEPKPDIDVVVKERRYTEVELDAIRQTNEKYPEEEAAEEQAVVEEAAQTNVFEADEEWNWQYEIAQRTKHAPYIIHFDEFQQNEPEHDQVSYTYYEADDVLSDTRDTTIDDMDKVIGIGNLGRWGHGSNDPNVVYIRNEKIGLDAEVVRDPGSFSDTVHGSIRHSEDRRRRIRRRFDDDESIR